MPVGKNVVFHDAIIPMNTPKTESTKIELQVAGGARSRSSFRS